MGGKERQLIELLKGLIDKKQIKVKLVIMNKDVHYPEVYDLDIDINFLIDHILDILVLRLLAYTLFC